MSKVLKQGTIHLGKVDYNKSGRRNCACNLTYELKETDKGTEFTAQGEVWNHLHTDIYCGGQCVDTLVDKYGRGSAKAKRLKAIWERYHLNGMRAGSAIQEQYLRDHPLDPESYNPKSHYEVASKYLKDAGLNPDPNGYLYGHAWVYEPIPQEIIEEILSW
jgi:hypothetical protein